MKKIFAFVFFVANTFLLAPPVLAQGLKNAAGKLGTTANKAGVSEQGNIDSLVGTIIRASLALVGIIFLSLMVYAGFLWMTAKGEDSQIEKAKNIISASLIGMVVVLGAYAITTLVIGRFS